MSMQFLEYTVINCKKIDGIVKLICVENKSGGVYENISIKWKSQKEK